MLPPDITQDKFVDYLAHSKQNSLHPELLGIIDDLPDTLLELPNVLLHGAPGVGKYTQALNILAKYSPTGLRFERRISVAHNKDTYSYIISDVHIEIDMKTLGCNAKLLWDSILGHLDIMTRQQNKPAFAIMCKNFDNIRNDLLEGFYSYMSSFTNTMNIGGNQQTHYKFILITENVSHISRRIRNLCLRLPVSRPANVRFKSIIPKGKNKQIAFKALGNTKDALYLGSTPSNVTKVIEKLMAHIKNAAAGNSVDFIQLRLDLYDILVYNLSTRDILDTLASRVLLGECGPIKDKQIKKMFVETNNFFKLYNNNYRAIYHLEKYIMLLALSLWEC